MLTEYDPFDAARLNEIRADAERWVGRTGNGFSPFTVLRLLATIDMIRDEKNSSTCGCPGATDKRTNPNNGRPLLLCARHADLHDNGHGFVVHPITEGTP